MGPKEGRGLKFFAPLKSPLRGAESKERVFEEEVHKKPTFNASNPEHRAKAQQLHKTYKNKDKVREILRREFEGI